MGVEGLEQEAGEGGEKDLERPPTSPQEQAIGLMSELPSHSSPTPFWPPGGPSLPGVSPLLHRKDQQESLFTKPEWSLP